jgi:hypothetical protein
VCKVVRIYRCEASWATIVLPRRLLPKVVGPKEAIGNDSDSSPWLSIGPNLTVPPTRHNPQNNAGSNTWALVGWTTITPARKLVKQLGRFSRRKLHVLRGKFRAGVICGLKPGDEIFQRGGCWQVLVSVHHGSPRVAIPVGVAIAAKDEGSCGDGNGKGGTLWGLLLSLW